MLVSRSFNSFIRILPAILLVPWHSDFDQLEWAGQPRPESSSTKATRTSRMQARPAVWTFQAFSIGPRIYFVAVINQPSETAQIDLPFRPSYRSTL